MTNITSSPEYFATSTKKPRGRGMAQKSLDLIQAAADFLETAHPTTVRGVCYRLFVDGVIPSMAKGETKKVSRLVTIAREQGTIPWEWIVDETRKLERTPSWKDPDAYVKVVRESYRRNFWAEQPGDVEVWSEKGTVRGVLDPVLREYGVGFRVMHGFGSATSIHDAAQGGCGRDLTVLYVGDWDPSGLFMSEKDLPERLALRRRPCGCTADRAYGLGHRGSGAAFVRREHEEQGPAPRVVHRELRVQVLGAGRDAPEHAPRSS